MDNDNNPPFNLHSDCGNPLRIETMESVTFEGEVYLIDWQWDGRHHVYRKEPFRSLNVYVQGPGANLAARIIAHARSTDESEPCHGPDDRWCPVCGLGGK